MKTLTLLAALLFIQTGFAETDIFKLSVEVATCFVLVPQAIESAQDQLGHIADKQCKELHEELKVGTFGYLDVHSMGRRNFCNGVKVTQLFFCH